LLHVDSLLELTMECRSILHNKTPLVNLLIPHFLTWVSPNNLR